MNDPVLQQWTTTLVRVVITEDLSSTFNRRTVIEIIFAKLRTQGMGMNVCPAEVGTVPLRVYFCTRVPIHYNPVILTEHTEQGFLHSVQNIELNGVVEIAAN